MAVILNTVSGTIYDAFDAPMANVTVQAYDKDLRTEQLLGQALTDARGFYSISYDASKWVDSEATSPDVFIRVGTLINTGIAPIFKILGESPVNFNVPQDFRLDFKIGNTPIKALNEFEALVQLIKPLTEPQRVALADLQENEKFKDISFLANETGEAAEKIALLPTAFTLSGKTEIAADIFYGLFLLQFPTDLNALLLIKSESIADGIRKAISENIISAKWGEQVDSIAQRLNQLATGAILAGTDDNSAAFKQIMSAALPNADQQQAFVNVYLANEKTPEKFWDALAQQPGFDDPNTLAGIQSVLQLNLLTNYQPALTTLLYQEQQQNPALKDMRGFAEFSFDDWHTRIKKLVVSGELKNFPDGIEGNTPEEKAVNYADSMTQLVKTLYPTDFFIKRLNQDTSNAFKESKTDLTTFFANNADYDLKNNNINRLFDAANLTGIADKALLKKELVTINRLYKLTDNYSHVSALNLEGIDSATALVNQYSPVEFAKKFAAAMPPETAAAIYQKAQQIDNRATVLAMSFKMRNDIPIYAINGPANDAPPDYASLFGDTNCDCEHCQSVYSPSAYFVDILHILSKYNMDAFTKLTTRRPDLTQILLTCKNTNTALPYIDMVNELLENTIASVPPIMVNGEATYPHLQTANSADELLAYPEHINIAAYEPLKTAASAFNLPLNLPLEETRLYLDKLGVKRYGLMEQYFGKQPESKYTDLPIAAEYLQLSQTELNIVNGTLPMPVILDKVTDFLDDTGLSYIEMLQLLECDFINPLVNGERSIKVVATADDQATCNIADLKLQSSQTTSLKVMPFIRLRKKTGWDILDLDRVFRGLGVTDFAGDVNSQLIVPLAHVARMKAKFNLSIENIMTLWSTIDTYVYVDHAREGQPKLPTQFESLFQNKQVANPIDPAFSNPSGLSGTLAEKAEIILAALNLSQKDFSTLDQPRFVDGNLTLANLSVLFRYSMLARALKLSISELIDIIDLTGLNPFGNSLLSAVTLTFIDKVDFIRSLGFSIPELKGLLEKSTAISQPRGLNNIAKVLTDIRDGLKKIELLDPIGNTPQEQAENKLKNQNNFITETLGAAFKTEAKVIDILINNLVKSVADNTQPAITPFIDVGFITSDEPLFKIDSSNVTTWTFPDLFNTYVLLGDTWNRISRLILKLKISNDEFIYFQRNESALAISGIWNLPTLASGNVLFPSFENLSNIIRFRNALALPTVDWFKLFDFAILNAVDAKKNFIDSLSNLSHLTTASIESLLGKADNVNDIGMLKYAFPADYLNGALLLTVIDCAKMADQLGSGAENIAKLIIPIPTAAQENEAAELSKSLLKAKYDAKTWLSIIQPISNQLRIKKRDALISYLLTSPAAAIAKFRQDNSISDTNSLYAFFLIDLEMDACMLTSRIKQAISSTQLFVDRCLMNLETEIVLGANFTKQWNTWRKRYRVWEANRKIFLYPENWIEPELRDDKSPFFKELESRLKQNEITDETAEDALRYYLEKLDIVANLEMVGVYPDSLTGIVHVIGRTRHIPHQYFYTKQIKSVWSAWEKVDLDIEGDHILPVVWNNRLMLFWAQFTEKEEQDPDGFNVPAAGENIPPNPRYLEIKLAWSEYKKGKWSAKKISKDSISTLNNIVNSLGDINKNVSQKQIILSSRFIDNKLYIILLAWADPYRKYFDKQKLDSFFFNNCNSAPLIAHNSSLPLEYFEIIDNTNSDGMTLGEKDQAFKSPSGDDTLTIFNTGLCKFHISQTSNVVILNNTPGTFQILPNHHNIAVNYFEPFFYKNERNNFYVHSVGGFIRPRIPLDDIRVLTQGVLINRRQVDPFPLVHLPLENSHALTVGSSTLSSFPTDIRNIPGLVSVGPISFSPIFLGKHYAFQTFYHPYICELIETLNTSGIEGLYKNLVSDIDGKFKDGIQNKIASEIFIPNGAYNPTNLVNKPYPVEQVDFSYSGIYSIYNWELFFHIPLLIATRLSQNQKFDEARKWFHYLFDPTRSLSPDITGPQRFWITKPFKDEIQKGVLSIEDLFSNGGADLDLQLTNWESHPFNPHAVARLRISAYMRSTVKKYIDNLIAWGDQLFRQNTLETINEATLLYVLAANILGKKPDRVPARATPKENSFSTIQNNLDSFSNAKVAIQSFFSLSDVNSDSSIDNVMMPLFCIPKNDMLLGYWDTVADRLFKIRHCLNIEGVFQQLPLFEPPIDPALLVKATAAGLDLSSILNDISVQLPNYRFQVLLQKANEICNDVKGLGGELMNALEKKDAEQLALLRSSHEINLLDAVRDIKVSQIDEAQNNLDSLIKSKEVLQARRDYYGSRKLKNDKEQNQIDSINLSLLAQEGAIGSELVGLVFAGLPQVTTGLWSWGVTFGGKQLADGTKFMSSMLSMAANERLTSGSISGIEGGYQRRQDDWTFQTQSADLELKQIDKQIAAAEIRLAIAEKDLENHDLQIEQSKEVDDFLNGKYTNEELYDYMVGQISSVYFQSYQLAYNTAKKTEKCLQFELGIQNTSFINFGYWDSLKKGLLSGEKLQYDLRRLEAAYLEQNRRKFELSKNISLLLLDPLALVTLRETGQCSIELPEEIFDLDFPGHYFRRIKSVSITLPCVVGPYTTISCTLRLVKNSIRITPTLTGDNGYSRNADDDRFVENNIPVKAIAVSNAQNDSGVFELNFRDERYLPFEGAGAISRWSLELFSDLPPNNPDPGNPDFGKPFRQFDYDTISDAILHVKYTAREDTGPFKNAAITHLRDYLSQDGTIPSLRMFNLRQEFPTQWYRFLNPTNPANGNIFELELMPSLFRILDSNKTLKVNKIWVLARCTDAGSYTVAMTPPLPVVSNTITLTKIDKFGGLYANGENGMDVSGQDIQIVLTDPPVKWQLKMTRPGSEDLQKNEVEDLMVVLGYEWE
ncbi:MAG: Tc toxin subunit A-related protein [Methylobacter sp.]